MRTRYLTVAVVVAVLWLGMSAVSAESADRYAGRPLVQVLEELRESGLDLIFSTAVVDESLRVQSEPSATEPREILDQILAALGLEAREGATGSISIVPRQLGVGAIEGRVLVDDGRAPIGGATVRVVGTRRSVLTDAGGSFRLEGIPEGVRELRVEAFGFAGEILPGVRVGRDTVTALEVSLRSRSKFVTEIVVTPNRHSVGAEEPDLRRDIDAEEVRLVPAIAGDVSRVVESLPGVSAQDNSAAFHIRGSGVDDVSIILDGLELYDPFHLRSFQSPFSLVDSSIVDRIDFLGGGFTADLGDRHGGFIDIATYHPEVDGQNGVELGTMNSGARFGGTLKRGDGSWLVAARAWYPEAVKGSLELGAGEKLDPRLVDLYAKTSFTVTPRTLLSVHGLLAYDRISFAENNTDPTEDNETANALTRTGYAWLRAVSSWTPAVSSETIVSLGRIERRRSGDSLPDDDTDVRVDDDRDVDFIGVRHDTRWQIGEAQVVKGGFDLRRLGAEYRYSLVDRNEPADSISFDVEPDGASVGVYAAYRARIHRRLITELGLRWDRQAYTDDNQISPRLNVAWNVGSRSELRFGVGRFNQSQRIHELHVEDGETEFGRAEVSKQAEVTFQHAALNGLSFRADAYYRKLSKLRPRYENLFRPLELFPETGDDRVEVAPDRAELQGVELLLRGRQELPLFWWVSYTLSSSDDIIGGRKVPRSWDQTHAGKFLVGYRWDQRWSVSLGGSIHTGWPTTPIFGVIPPGETEPEAELGERNSERYPTYMRLDAKVRRTFQTPKGRISLTFEALNLTDRRNICCTDEVEFEVQPGGSIVAVPELDAWLGITGSFSVLWEF